MCFLYESEQISVMNASSITKKPITIVKNSMLSEVISKLLEHKISRLVILDDNAPIGIITEKDIGLFLFSNNTKFGLDKISLSQIMHKIVFVDKEKSLEECSKMMIERNVSSLVTGNDREIDGIFTKSDLVKYYGESYHSKNKVVDFMTTDYIFSYSSAPLFKIIRKMIDHKISRIIIKNQQEESIGVISFRDLFRISLELGNEEDDTGYTLSDNIRRGFLSEEGFGGISLARDIMTRGLFAVKFNDDLAYACEIMMKEKVSGLGVLDGNGALAGVISKTDVVRALSKI